MNHLKFSRLSYIFFVLFVFLLVTGCHEQKTMKNIKEENLFSINYGNFENEIKFFAHENNTASDAKIEMKDGFFFIADDSAKKIMQFNSYGDLLGIIYNPDCNPTPSFVKKIGQEKYSDANSQVRNTTQISQAYKFNSLQKIAVDSKKGIYVVEQVAPENRKLDPEKNIVLRQVILHFSNDGTPLDYIGQEGPAGTPFPFIDNIYTTKNDELVVVTITSQEHLIYWFNSRGHLKWKIPIRWNYIPDAKSEQFITIDKIAPDYSSAKLYIKTDYHKTYVDEESNIQTGIKYHQTLLHVFNIDTEKFENPVEIPPYEDVVVDKFSKLVYKTPFDFLGPTDSNTFFFIAPDDSGFVVQVIQSNGQRITKRHINYDKTNASFISFSLSNNGIISALIAKEENADVLWWRTDSLIER